MKHFKLNLLATMMIVAGAFAFASCSKSDDDNNKKVDENVLTAEKLAGVWYASYAEDVTEGDQH